MSSDRISRPAGQDCSSPGVPEGARPRVPITLRVGIARRRGVPKGARPRDFTKIFPALLAAVLGALKIAIKQCNETETRHR